MDGHHYYGNATQVCTFIYGLFTYKARDHTPCPLPKDIRFSWWGLTYFAYMQLAKSVVQ
jgi:hypothetical protein